jgi:hypothetical protein
MYAFQPSLFLSRSLSLPHLLSLSHTHLLSLLPLRPCFFLLELWYWTRLHVYAWKTFDTSSRITHLCGCSLSYLSLLNVTSCHYRHPARAREQHKVLVERGPFGPGKPFQGQPVGRFLVHTTFISPAVPASPAYCCVIGTKFIVKEAGPRYNYCATIVGHDGLKTLTEIMESRGPYLTANRPFKVEFDNQGADDEIHSGVSKFKLQIGNHILMQPLNSYFVGRTLTVVDSTGKWVEVKVTQHLNFSRYTLRRLIVSPGNWC